MPACPRCAHPLALASGIHRDEHGVFFAQNELRRRMSPDANASLRAALKTAPLTAFACPSCLSALREARVALPGQADLALEGCGSCGGWWFDDDEMERLMAAVLSKPVEQRRSVGGYGGTTLSPKAYLWHVPEALFAMLKGLGA